MSQHHQQCPECKSDQLDRVDPDDEDQMLMCMDCGFEVSSADLKVMSMYDHYCVGVVKSATPLKGGSLTKLQVNVVDDSEDDGVCIVTNAKYPPNEGDHVVCALIDACVPATTDRDDPNAVIVKKTSVGGVASSGMICDAPMLGWKGTKGKVVLVPSLAIGSKPPANYPLS